MITTIPFQGFYHSIHDGVLDAAVELMLSDDNGDVNPSISDAFWSDGCKWGDVHDAYARIYAQDFAIAIGLESLKFKELLSPKFYNFETDRIFCSVSLKDVERMFNEVSTEDLEKQIHDSFTSYDGFFSYYSNKLEDWIEKPLLEFDCNEVGTLLRVYADSILGVELEYEIMENPNEVAYDAVSENLTEAGTRVVNIADYLRTRQERA